MDIGKRPDKITRETTPSPTQPIGTVGSARGVVKWWQDAKGYGAISCAELDPWDIWCHFAHIEGTGFRSLTPGDIVEVEYVRVDQESFKFVAQRVRRLVVPTDAPDDAG